MNMLDLPKQSFWFVKPTSAELQTVFTLFEKISSGR